MADDAAELGERHQREMAEMADRQSQERRDTFNRQSKEMLKMFKDNPDFFKPGYGEGEPIPSDKSPMVAPADQGEEINPATRTRDTGNVVDPMEFMSQKQAQRYKTQRDAAVYLREHKPGAAPLSDPAYWSGKDI